MVALLNNPTPAEIIAFTRQHGLGLVVTEPDPSSPSNARMWQAAFRDALYAPSEQDPRFSKIAGEGRSPDAAVSNLFSRIGGTLLLISQSAGRAQVVPVPHFKCTRAIARQLIGKRTVFDKAAMLIRRVLLALAIILVAAVIIFWNMHR